MAEVLSSPLLAQFSWLSHGFGTRHAALTQESMASLQQIHSSITLVADRPRGCAGTGDGLIADQPGVTVSVRTADCFPILLADTRRRVVAAVHAGWRGTVSRVVVETLEKMHARFGTDPADVWAAIGPGIGVCCYEVGADVASLLGVNSRDERSHYVDLATANRRQLVSAGVQETQIEMPSACTFCDAGQFHSYRRDRERAGRQISFIGVLNA